MVFSLLKNARRLPLIVLLHVATAALLLATGTTASADEVRWLDFSGNGTHLAALTSEGNVAVFDSESGERIAWWPELAQGDEAAWRPGRNELAVVRDMGNGWDIWLVGLDGSQRRLTRHPAMDCAPQWRADGNRLVFVSYRSGDADVWEMAVSESNETPVLLTGGKEDQWGVRTQPHGDDMAWCEIAGDKTEARCDGKGQENRTLGALGETGGHVWPEELTWDASGTRALLATGTPPDMTLWAIDPASGKRETVAMRKWVAHAALDMTSGAGAIHSNEGLEILRRDAGGTSWTVASVVRFEGLHLGVPSLSGERVAFAVARRGVGMWEADSGKARLLFLDVDTHLEIARELSKSGRTKAAERLCIEAAEHGCTSSERVEAELCRARVLRRGGKAKQALAILDAIANREGTPPETIREAMLERAEQLLCDLKRPKDARETWSRILASSPDMDASEIPAVRLLDSGREREIEHYARAARAAARGNAEVLYEALEKIASQRRGSVASAAATIELLTEARAGNTGTPQWADRAARVYQGVARQLHRLSNKEENETANALLERARVERLRALLTARDFVSAREQALEIVKEHGLGSLGGIDFLRYYVETDRSGRRIHALMGRVLLSPEVAETLETELANDAAGRCLLALARTKLALLEGEMRETRDMLAQADELFHQLPDADFSADIARLQIYLWIFQAKYQERLAAWDAAIASYDTVEALLRKYWPDNDFLVFEVARTRAELRAGRSCPELLQEVLLVERGMGDPILNPTDDEVQLRLGARNLLERLRGAEASPLDGFIRFHVGRHLGRAGDNHAATHYLTRALETGEATTELRTAVLWEKAGLADLSKNHWLRIRACESLTVLPLPSAQRNSVRLHQAEAELALGRRKRALGLAREALYDSRLESLRTRAQQVMAEASGGER